MLWREPSLSLRPGTGCAAEHQPSASVRHGGLPTLLRLHPAGLPVGLAVPTCEDNERFNDIQQMQQQHKEMVSAENQ